MNNKIKEKENHVSCLKCGKSGIERMIEILPTKGHLFKVFHEDGKICEFVEYPNLSIFLERNEPRKNNKEMTCPKCNEIGIICSYRPNKEKKSNHYFYYLRHERVDGYWGQKIKVPKHRRCYMKTKEHKKLVLESLGDKK